MPVTSKEVQTVFCGLFRIIKKLHKKTLNQTQLPTSLFIDKALKIAKLELKNSTDVNTACSKLRVQFIKKMTSRLILKSMLKS